MSRPDGPNSSDSPPEEQLKKTRRKAPWTEQARKIALVGLGTATFGLFLYGMLLKWRGGDIAYQDLFLLLSLSGSLLGVNFLIDLAVNIIKQADS